MLTRREMQNLQKSICDYMNQNNCPVELRKLFWHRLELMNSELAEKQTNHFRDQVSEAISNAGEREGLQEMCTAIYESKLK